MHGVFVCVHVCLCVCMCACTLESVWDTVGTGKEDDRQVAVLSSPVGSGMGLRLSDLTEPSSYSFDQKS